MPASVAVAVVKAVITYAISKLVVQPLLKSMGIGQPKVQEQGAIARELSERTQLLRSPVATRQIIYGRAQTSGALVYYESAGNNKTHHMIIAFAGHECEGNVADLFLDDNEVGTLDGNGNVTTGKYAGAARFQFKYGTDDQTAFSSLVAESTKYTDQHRMRGISVCYLRFDYSQDLFPTGIPNIRFTVSGKKLYDPRTTLTTYSNNSALCAMDWTLNQFGATLSDMTLSTWISAANVCDESVALKDGGSENRYECNGILRTSIKNREGLQQINSSCGGLLTTPQGAYSYAVAAYNTPSGSFNEDDFSGALRIRPRHSKKSLYNRVSGIFVNPDNFWQQSDFPSIKNDTYATLDGGVIQEDVQFLMTTSSTMAQRLAKILLEKSRQSIMFEAPMKINALSILPNENKLISMADLGWTNKVFTASDIRIAEDGGTKLTWIEDASEVYDWSEEETIIDPAPDTNLPVTSSIAKPGNVQMAEELYETTGSAGVKARAILTWDAPDDEFLKNFEIEYRVHDGVDFGNWIELFNIPKAGDAITPSYVFWDLAPGLYQFKVEAYNIFNTPSGYTDPLTFEVFGLTAPPSDVEGFSVSVFDGQASANWNLTIDLDVRIGGKSVIRFSPLTIGATWEDGTIFGEFTGDTVSAPVPLATGTYLIKFVDSTNNYSENAVSFVVSEDLISGWTTVATVTEDPTFSGTKTNVFADGSVLKLTGTTLFDDIPDFDAVVNLDAGGRGNCKWRI